MESVFRPGLFLDQVLFITGGGSGIGLYTAREFAYLGGKLFLVGRKLEKLTKAAAQLRQEHGVAQVEFASCDVREVDQVEKAVERCLDVYGRIDCLVNCAGGQFPAPAVDISPKGWTAVINTNLNGLFFMSQAVHKKAFVPQKSGRIVNVIANMWNGFPLMAHTGAARAGVENLTKTLGTEWGRVGVRVNAVAPGLIASSGLDTYDEGFKKALQFARAFNQAYRFGTEAEVAAAILFLLSPAASYITGTTLRIDAGESNYHPILPPIAHENSSVWSG